VFRGSEAPLIYWYLRGPLELTVGSPLELRQSRKPACSAPVLQAYHTNQGPSKTQGRFLICVRALQRWHDWPRGAESSCLTSAAMPAGRWNTTRRQTLRLHVPESVAYIAKAGINIPEVSPSGGLSLYCRPHQRQLSSNGTMSWMCCHVLVEYRPRAWHKSLPPQLPAPDPGECHDWVERPVHRAAYYSSLLRYRISCTSSHAAAIAETS